MPALVVPNGVRVVLDWSNPNGEHLNVIHLLVDGTFIANQGTADLIRDGVSADLTASGLLAHLDNAASFNGVRVTDLRTEGQPTWISNLATPVPGTSTGAFLPGDVAMCVTLRTAFFTRRGRGRIFLGGFTHAALVTTTGRILPAASTAASAFVNALRARVWPGNGLLAVMSRLGTGTPLNPVPIVRPVITALVRDDKWDTQRRRDD